MAKKLRLGVLTPSSNTALEPLTQAIVGGLRGVSAHFARFPVTEISLRSQALGQFRIEPILQAAELLADARVDAIAWSGTSAGWMGFAADEALCAEIEKRTGIPATSSVLALNELLRLANITTMGLVTPYVPDVQERIVANYAAIGVRCVAERHLDLSVNYEFANVTGDTLQRLIGEVAAAKPQAITTFCTNLTAAGLAEWMDTELGIPLLDTVSTAVWGLLRKAGADPSEVTGWGSMFAWGSPGQRHAA